MIDAKRLVRSAYAQSVRLYMHGQALQAVSLLLLSALFFGHALTLDFPPLASGALAVLALAQAVTGILSARMALVWRRRLMDFRAAENNGSPRRAHRSWDAELNALLDEHGIERCRRCVATIGGVEVWIANWPYAFGAKHGPTPDIPEVVEKWHEPLPSMSTRRRLRDVVRAYYGKSEGMVCESEEAP